MIVKIQIPLASNHSRAPALVYNKDRSFDRFYPITKELKEFMQKEVKCFAEIKKGKNLEIIKKLPDQGW